MQLLYGLYSAYVSLYTNMYTYVCICISVMSVLNRYACTHILSNTVCIYIFTVCIYVTMGKLAVP